MSTQIQIRRDTTANWESVNPVLADGEIGYDTTANKFKVGNGTDAWLDIEYSSSGGGSGGGSGGDSPTYTLPVVLRSGNAQLPLTLDGKRLAVMTRGGEIELPLAA